MSNPPSRSAEGLLRGSAAGTGRPSATHRRLALGLLLIACAGVAWWSVTPRPSPLEPEVALASLVCWDGRLVHRNATNTPFTGWVTTCYADGTLKSRSQVIAGVLDGVSEGWHPNGQLQVREQFVSGMAAGPVLKWHSNGTKLSEGMARAGQLEGIFRRWHPNGTLAEELNLRAGQADGLSRAWFSNGLRKAEVLLERGAVVRQQFWNDGDEPGPAAAARHVASSRPRQND